MQQDMPWHHTASGALPQNPGASLRAAQLVCMLWDIASVSISPTDGERGWFGPRREQQAARLLQALKHCLMRDVGGFRLWKAMLDRALCSLRDGVLLGTRYRGVKQISALFFPCT